MIAQILRHKINDFYSIGPRKFMIISVKIHCGEVFGKSGLDKVSKVFANLVESITSFPIGSPCSSRKVSHEWLREQ